MTPQTIVTLTKWCHGLLLQGEGDALVRSVSTDSRTLAPDSLFVALQGENFDAHDFLAVAAANGARAFLVSRELSRYPSGAVILVKDTLVALQALAKSWRKAWGHKVVGLTGSNGKTSTKDLVTAVLSQEFNTHATKGNLNNHIGLPLTILEIQGDHQVAVCEMGMNHPGEIAPLADIAAPDAAIITNIGTAHIEHMGSREGIAKEKATLAWAVAAEGAVILNADDDFTNFIGSRCPALVLTAGFSEHADIRVSEFQPDASGSQFMLQLPNLEAMPVKLPIPGRHMASNAALAAALGYHFGLSAEQIIAGLESVTLNKGRLQRRVVKGITLIDDSYNANPDSMNAALETLLGMPCEGRRIAVLGRMGERGAHAEKDHENLGMAVAAAGFPMLCTVGEDESKLIAAGARAANATTEVHSFSTHAECAAFLARMATPSDLVLIKGSRSAAMEKIIELLNF